MEIFKIVTTIFICLTVAMLLFAMAYARKKDVNAQALTWYMVVVYILSAYCMWAR